MKNLSKQTVFTPAAKKTVKTTSRQGHPETLIEIYLFTHLDKRYQNAHPLFLIRKTFFIFPPLTCLNGERHFVPLWREKISENKKFLSDLLN